MTFHGHSPPLIACLLPVRNGATELPGWFASVEQFADAVIALDDGSTDDTANILKAHPLVTEMLSNPRRDTYVGWDDSGNRNRLLEAADRVRPVWVMSLDADERLTADDASALRDFLEHSAVPGLAYGFRVYRMIHTDEEPVDTYDRAGLWVYRLHAHQIGQRVPTERLHFVPVPTSIPQERWVRTTLRIQHLASVTQHARKRRYDKYTEADGDRRFQGNYELLLDEPEELHHWEPRRSDLPVVLVDEDDSPPMVAPHDEAPVLSAIVISLNDENRIERAVEAVVSQQLPEPFEVIVVTSGTDRTADIVRERFPSVTLVELPEPALPGRARNAGLQVARGEYVSFPGSHVELLPNSLAARLRAHEAGWDMVTGSTVNGNETYAGWASYFLDHSSVLPGRPPTVLEQPPSHCSYRTSVLRSMGGFPEDRRTGEDTVVNQELFRRGHTALRAPDVVLVHSSPVHNLRRLAAHHFRRGRGLGRIILENNRRAPVLRDRALMRRLAIDYLPNRLRQVGLNVERWGGDLDTVHRQVRPGIAVGAAGAWAGAWWELLRPRRGWSDSLMRPTAPTSPTKVLTTGYCPCELCCPGWADGLTSTLVNTAEQPRGIATDNGLIPIGTQLDIPGYGVAVVDDTGTAMQNSAREGIIHVDLRFADHADAMAWGMRWLVVDLPAELPATRLPDPGPHAELPDGVRPVT